MELQYIDPKELVIVGYDTDHKAGEHALFDERVKFDLDQDLVRNIIVYGVLQPIVIREEDGQLLVVDGRQRVRAAREAALRQEEMGAHKVKVPVTYERGDDSRMMGVMISTNEHRKGDDLLVKARKAQRLYSYSRNKAEVAIAFGKTEQTIDNWFSLLEADPAIHQAIEDKKISASAGIELSRLKTREEQREMLGKMLAAAEQEVGQDPSKKAANNVMISESEVKKAREEKGERKPQPGVKRTWLKKALKTKAAEALSDEQKGVLEWIVSGQSDRDTWWDDFAFDVRQELGEEE